MSDENYVDNLLTYIKRYKTRVVADALREEVYQQPGETVLEKCTRYLLSFVYTEIERKRRVAIQSMAEVARHAASAKDPDAADQIIRQELLAYLEESPFTQPLADLVDELAAQEWVDVLGLKDAETGLPLLHSVDGARQLLGACRRTLESYPYHPGLLFLGSLARLLLPDPDMPSAMDEIRESMRGLAVLHEHLRNDAIERLFSAYRTWLFSTRDFEDVYRTIANIILDEYPERSTALLAYRACPDRSKQILIGITLRRVQSLAQQIGH